MLPEVAAAAATSGSAAVRPDSGSTASASTRNLVDRALVTFGLAVMPSLDSICSLIASIRCLSRLDLLALS